MKLNWGTGLTIFFIIFIGTLVFVVYQSTQVNDSLVVKNYYEDDLNYQSIYNKKQNTENQPIKVKIDYKKEMKEILLTFPLDSISQTSGNILLYNPVSDKGDVKFDFELGNESTYKFPVDKIQPGRWKIKIDWKQGNKEYYQEEEVVI